MQRIHQPCESGSYGEFALLFTYSHLNATKSFYFLSLIYFILLLHNFYFFCLLFISVMNSTLAGSMSLSTTAFGTCVHPMRIQDNIGLKLLNQTGYLSHRHPTSHIHHPNTILFASSARYCRKFRRHRHRFEKTRLDDVTRQRPFNNIQFIIS